MKKKIQIKIQINVQIIFLLLLSVFLLNGQDNNTDPTVDPDNSKDDVTLLKKIYSETQLKDLLFGGKNKEDDPFVVPDNLKDNVDFWKQIYTEVSLKDGLIHDREYPLVIYKKITIGTLRGRRRRQVIRNHINQIAASLRVINQKKSSQWGVKEKKIVDMFKRYGDIKKLKSARSRIRFQQGQKERFREGLERSGAYMDHIRRVFKEYKIPQRITYLPHVESSFQVKAYSRVGAAGIWQFMRRTGRLYLKVGYRVDERWDPYKSTEAAAKLLQSNYRQLKSWPLAITAYNHGLPSMMRAVRVTKSRDIGVIIEKYRNRRFRFASKNFYGCFMAASEIAANPDKYFDNLSYDQPWKYNEVVLENYVRPRVLSKHLGIKQEELQRLNPSLRPTVFRRQLSVPRGFKLRIPASISKESFNEKLAVIPSSQKENRSGDFDYYSVKRGDTLYRISRKYGVSVRSLLESNNVDWKNRIYVGQVLRIPVKNKPSEKKVKEKILAQKKESKSNTVSSSIHHDKPPQSTKTESEKSSSTVAKKMKENNENKISATDDSEGIGAKDAEPFPDPAENKDKSSGESFDATLYNLEARINAKKGTAAIRVAVDETLGHYADWLQVSVYSIRRLNHLRHRRGIKINQKIYLPMTRDKMTAFNTRRLEYHMALEEDFYDQYHVVDVKERKVRYGETLWSICNNEDEIPMWLFKKYNRHLDINKIHVNTLVKLPVIKRK